VRAGRNPLSVLTIFRFAAYLNLVQNPMVLFGLAPCGTDFSFLYWKPQVLPSQYASLDIFCSVANHLWLSIARPQFLHGERSFLCRSSSRAPARTTSLKLEINFNVAKIFLISIYSRVLGVRWWATQLHHQG